MRNLLLFLIRNQNFFIFIFLQLICLVLLVNYQYYHQARFLGSAQELTGSYYSITEGTRDYFQLRKLNDSLRKANTDLINRLNNYRESVNSKDALPLKDSLRLTLPKSQVDTILTDTAKLKRVQQYQYLSANVVNNTVNKRNNYITLSRGSKQDMKAPMGLMTHRGIVGIITNVSQNYSVGISVLHNDFSLSCEVKSIGKIGALSWDGRNPEIVQLENLPTHINIKKGQEVVTSPYSRLFPPGVPVGEIVDYNKSKGANFYQVDVKLNVNLRSLHHVFAIKNRMLEEQMKVEKAAR